jgi:putative addiction module component (TIGR02574 family)
VSPSKVIEAALALPEKDRIELVERLLDTLGPETNGADDPGFFQELERRSKEVDSGKAETIPWSELKNEPL